MPITLRVLDELLVPLEYGYDCPYDILSRPDVVPATLDEFKVYEELRLQSRLSSADAKIIAIWNQRRWLYITMDKVALEAAQAAGVDAVDLQALPGTIKRLGLLDQEQLRALIDRMEQDDRTWLPYKESVLSSEQE